MNQFATNSWHFPPINSCLHTFPVCFIRESELNCREFTALSPMVHTLQVAHTGELPENHRESEPNFHESVALSPGTEKTGIAAGIYDLRRLTAAKNQALRRAHCGGSFVSGCYRSIAPNAQATSFAVKLPFSGIIGIAKIPGLFFCGFQDSGIRISEPRCAPFVCKILIINTFTIILTYHGRFRGCRPVFHPIAT